jgi:hypothetical protein
MSSTYNGTDAFPVAITIPSDGDLASAASVGVGFQGLADRTTYLNGRTGKLALNNTWSGQNTFNGFSWFESQAVFDSDFIIQNYGTPAYCYRKLKLATAGRVILRDEVTGPTAADYLVDPDNGSVFVVPALTGSNRSWALKAGARGDVVHIVSDTGNTAFAASITGDTGVTVDGPTVLVRNSTGYFFCASFVCTGSGGTTWRLMSGLKL